MRVKKWKYVIKGILGLLFCLSAVLKLISVGEFELYVFSCGLMSFDAATVWARLLIAGEFLLGAGLISDCCHRLFCMLCAVSLCLFTIFLLWRIGLGDEANCHCFGDLVDLNPWQSLIKNLVLAGGLVLCWHRPVSLNLWPIVVVGLLLAIGVFIYSPPDVWVRHRYAGDDLEVDMFKRLPVVTASDTNGRKVVCLYGTACPYCGRCMRKIDGIVARHGLDTAAFHLVFMATEPDMTSAVETFFESQAVEKHYGYTTLPVLDFLTMTNGLLPLVVLAEGGVPRGVYNYITLDEQTLVDFVTGEERKISD